MRQLTLRLPDQSHRNLRLIAAAREKNMTELVIDWIQREADALTTDPLLRALYSDSGLPTRDFSKKELEEFFKADDATPEKLKSLARKKLSEGKTK